MNRSRRSPAARSAILLAVGLAAWAAGRVPAAAGDEGASRPLSLEWADNFLTVSGAEIPGGSITIMYLEAYCRPGSTDRDWGETVIGHRTELIDAAPDGSRLVLQCALRDGVVVDHVITSGTDFVDFRLTATNPTAGASLAHWAQPCIHLDKFTGRGQEDYIPFCFLCIDGKIARLPTEPWATGARYVPGQVYCPKGVDRDDVNPRPLSDLVPSHSLCGCLSGDGEKILATAWEPYQEIFQGVVTCMHTDFRLGGLEPGETKEIKGKLYVVDADVPALVERYLADFPEQAATPLAAEGL